MAVHVGVPYCTQTDIEHMMSALGMKLRVDDDQDGYIGPDEQLAIQDAIDEATDTVNFYCDGKHPVAAMAESPWVNRQATKLALYAICTRKGNPAPESVQERAEKAEDLLIKIHETGYKIPGVPLQRWLAPTFSNIRMEPLRNEYRVIRVERNNSGPQKTQLRQNQDFREAYFPEL